MECFITCGGQYSEVSSSNLGLKNSSVDSELCVICSDRLH